MTLVPASDQGAARVHVGQLTSAEVAALVAARLDEAALQSLLTVRAAADPASVPIAGDYIVTSSALEFAPRVPFEPGRTYAVTFNPNRLPQPRDQRRIDEVLSVPANVRAATAVTRAWPTATVVPANLLRIYIEFSAPMGRADGLAFLRLLDDQGAAVLSPFIAGRADGWNADRTVYAAYLDPGHRRPEEAPGQPLGPRLHEGRQYTLEVDSRWLDAAGQPLSMSYRQTFQAGPPALTPVDPRKWQLTTPSRGRRDPAIVTFPAPLDAGLLRRALGVARDDGTPIAGAMRIDPGETRWNFVPDEVWRPGRYNLLVLSTLEDLAGNRIGKLFDRAWLTAGQSVSPVNQTKMPFEIR